MELILLGVHVVAAAAILILVLLQQGKGADMGAAFGSGSAGSIFGSAGSANFLSRSTAVAATVFFATSIALTYFGAHRPSASEGGVMQGVVSQPAAPVVEQPVAPAQTQSDIPK